jgi:hypothetical protein
MPVGRGVFLIPADKGVACLLSVADRARPPTADRRPPTADRRPPTASPTRHGAVRTGPLWHARRTMARHSGGPVTQHGAADRMAIIGRTDRTNAIAGPHNADRCYAIEQADHAQAVPCQAARHTAQSWRTTPKA